MSTSNRVLVLVQIADALAIPVEAFLPNAGRADDQASFIEEKIALLEAFERIQDRQARQRCVSYVKAAAERSLDRG